MGFLNSVLYFKKNLSWLFGEKVIVTLFGLLISISLARYLTPESYGEYSYVLSILSLFSIFTTMGLDDLLVRNIIKNNQTGILLSTSFWIRFFGSTLSFILIGLFSYFTDNHDVFLLVIMIAISYFLKPFDVVEAYLKSEEKQHLIAKNNIVSTLFYTICVFIGIYFKLSLKFFILTMIIQAIFKSLYYIFLIKNQFDLSIFKKNTAKNLINEGWIVLMVSSVSLLNMKLDQVFISKMVGNEDLANYSIAAKISDAWFLLPTVLSALLFPRMISLYDENPIKFKNFLINITLIMLSIAIPYLIFINFFSEEIVQIIFGSKYNSAHRYLDIYIWSGLPFFVFFAFNMVYYILKITKLLLRISIFSFCLNTVLNLILISNFGAIGAAYATLIVSFSTILYSLSILYSNRDRFNLKIDKNV